MSLVLRPVDILDVLALVPFGRKRLAAVLAREPPVRPVLVVLVLTPGADILEELGTRIASVVALSAPTKVVVQPNRREVPASETTAAVPLHPCISTQPGKETKSGKGKRKERSCFSMTFNITVAHLQTIKQFIEQSCEEKSTLISSSKSIAAE